MNVLTDTHALLWYVTDSPKISRKAKGIFDKSERGDCVVFIPTIVIAECLSIFERKKISFDFEDLLHRMRQSENYALIPLDHRIVGEMVNTKEVS